MVIMLELMRVSWKMNKWSKKNVIVKEPASVGQKKKVGKEAGDRAREIEHFRGCVSQKTQVRVVNIMKVIGGHLI